MKEIQFEEISKKILNGIDLDHLQQNGVRHDNAFRDLNSSAATKLANCYQDIFQADDLIDDHYTGDFVWESSNEIRVYGKFYGSSAGHPGLSTQGLVNCAGIIRENDIFFHSGHFHPKAINALHFMVFFINNSLNAYNDSYFESKEDLLTYLCEEFPIIVYYDDSENTTKKTTFLDLYEHVKEFGQFRRDDLSKAIKMDYESKQKDLDQNTMLQQSLLPSSIYGNNDVPLVFSQKEQEVESQSALCCCVIF
ncbi:hypothetical protein L3V83_05225 [Thiotrichales bacterium 19X7-9]|nr:hypothetical protein [Thiotrichales bacterium 19X7-9]